MAVTKLMGQHWHAFSYALYARVADNENWKLPQLPNGNVPYGTMNVKVPKTSGEAITPN